MEDKRGTKREHSPSAGGSPLPDDAETTPLALSGSPPSPRSPSVASLYRPCSLVFEQGNTFEKTPMLDPSSFIADTSHSEKLARMLFGDLSHDILGPPSNDKIIIINDSNDDGEAQEETTADIESTAAPTSADDAPTEVRIDNSDDQGPDQEADGRDNSGRSAGDP
jgi:hypothetical protein